MAISGFAPELLVKQWKEMHPESEWFLKEQYYEYDPTKTANGIDRISFPKCHAIVYLHSGYRNASENFTTSSRITLNGADTTVVYRVEGGDLYRVDEFNDWIEFSNVQNWPSGGVLAVYYLLLTPVLKC